MSTILDIERYVHHGHDVAVFTHLKGRHRDHCLCYQNCKFFKPGSGDHCKIAQENFDMCVRNTVVTPVYECAKYEPQTDRALETPPFATCTPWSETLDGRHTRIESYTHAGHYIVRRVLTGYIGSSTAWKITEATVLLDYTF